MTGALRLFVPGLKAQPPACVEHIMKRQIRKAFVTGASGFLGEALVRKLLSLGVSVRALVRSHQKGQLLRQLGAEIVVADIRDAAIGDYARGVDTVFHCAATVRAPISPLDAFYAVNVEGTKSLLEAFRKNDSLQRFVHVSTVAVVGETDPRHPAEEDAPCHPLDTYGDTKLLGERVVADFATTGFPAVIARPMWIYGANSLITSNLFRKIALRKLPMVGAASNTMQPIAVEDAVSGLLQCAGVKGIEGRTYNLAGPEILTIRSMCAMIAEAMGTTLPKLEVPMSVALPLAIVSESMFPLLGMNPPLSREKLEYFRLNNSYSIERAKKELDWTPQTTFREGARQVANQLLQQEHVREAASSL